MITIIDGHNLIPHVRGLALADLDDEMRLVDLLQTYARARRAQVLVFFDKAPPGFAGTRNFGTVRAVFVPAGRTADSAMVDHLRKMSKNQRQQARLVTSDRQVQAEARALGMAVIGSDQFAPELAGLPEPAPPPPADAKPAGQLEDWYKVFGIDAAQAERPIEPESTPRARKPRKRRQSRS